MSKAYYKIKRLSSFFLKNNIKIIVHRK